MGGGHKAPEYLEVNPNGTLPALVDGDLKLWESNAILQYAADKTEAFAHYPREAKKRADIHRWQFWRRPIGTQTATFIWWKTWSSQ